MSYELPEHIVSEVHQPQEMHVVAHCEGEDWAVVDDNPLTAAQQAHDHTQETGHVTRVMQTKITRTTFSRVATKELYADG